MFNNSGSFVSGLPYKSSVCTAGVGANLAGVNVVVEITGLPAVTVPVTASPGSLSPDVSAPAPPPASNKSSSIGPIAGGIAGGVIFIGTQHNLRLTSVVRNAVPHAARTMQPDACNDILSDK